MLPVPVVSLLKSINYATACCLVLLIDQYGAACVFGFWHVTVATRPCFIAWDGQDSWLAAPDEHHTIGCGCSSLYRWGIRGQ